MLALSSAPLSFAGAALAPAPLMRAAVQMKAPGEIGVTDPCAARRAPTAVRE